MILQHNNDPKHRARVLQNYPQQQDERGEAADPEGNGVISIHADV